jgi:hypothetical protein
MSSSPRELFIDNEGNCKTRKVGGENYAFTLSCTHDCFDKIKINNRIFIKNYSKQTWRIYPIEEIYIELDDHVSAFLDELQEKVLKQETSICEFTFMKLKKLSLCKYQEGFNIDIPMKNARKN